ncbi:MAG: metal ABC transporter substrate-binding protein [Thermoflexus sp.]
MRQRLLWLLVIVGIGLSACQPTVRQEISGKRLQVVATTSIVGDVVRQIGGDAIQLTVLLPIGADPHAFEPSPQDVARVAEAQVIFAVGAGLERFLEPILQQAGGKALRVELAQGIPLRPFEGIAPHIHHHEGESHEEESHAEEEGEWDPHLWLDPNNVITWTHTIEATFSQLDPDRAAFYRRNAEAYREELRQLDRWIQEQVAGIPPENRKLVTEHQVFGYFAHRYGFEQVGTILPGVSTVAQPSPQELAALEEAIRSLGVKAIFVSSTVDPALARRVAEDTGTRLVRLYVDSLGEPGGEADSYVKMMRYNVRAIVEALR